MFPQTISNVQTVRCAYIKCHQFNGVSNSFQFWDGPIRMTPSSMSKQIPLLSPIFHQGSASPWDGWSLPSYSDQAPASRSSGFFGDRLWIQPWIPRGAASDINGISIPDRLDRFVLHRVRDFSEYLMDFGECRKKDSYQFPACLLPVATILAPALCQKVNVIKGTSVAQPAASGRLLSLHLAFCETQTRHTRLPWFNEVRLWMSNMTRAAKHLGLCRLLDSSLSIGVEQFFLKLIASHKVRFITSNKRRYYEIMKAFI